MNKYAVKINGVMKRVLKAESAHEAWVKYRNLPVFGIIGRMVDVDPQDWGSSMMDADTDGREWYTTSFVRGNGKFFEVCVEKI